MIVAAPANESMTAPLRFRWLRRTIKRQPLGVVAAVILTVMTVTGLAAPLLPLYSPTTNNVGVSLSAPTMGHFFGTDQFGRDVFSRVIYGGRTSLAVGFGATALAAILAVLVGATSALLGGRTDYVIQRFVDVAQALPGLVLLVFVIIVLGRNLTNLIVALAISQGISMSRVIRGTVIQLRPMPFIEAARAVGASEAQVLVRHVLPNIVPIMLTLTSVAIGAIIVAEASLSFLGYGVPPPNPSWGGMMSAEGRLYMIVNPWILIFPTLALVLVVFSFNMLGDAIRDLLDPRLRGSGL